jgi:hypothetical protein
MHSLLVEADMKFILVNDRKPRQRPFCTTCCEPIQENYLRDIVTRLTYCGCACYAKRRVRQVLTIENCAKAS